ncbi:MAG: hypothetical protein GXO47_08885 [Chlorobi bacterium]|nr:hypothetical protein [Chlorobiota bacterium]
MIQINKYNLKKNLNNILLFFFFMFAVSDLVELHLRIFFSYEVSINTSFSGKTANTHVKVKEGKNKVKPSNHGGNPNFALNSSGTKMLHYFVFSTYALPSIIIIKDSLPGNILIPRAPPVA